MMSKRGEAWMNKPEKPTFEEFLKKQYSIRLCDFYADYTKKEQEEVRKEYECFER